MKSFYVASIWSSLKMADQEGEPVDNNTNNQENATENGTNDIQAMEMKGWLMKRTKITHKWIKTYFHLTNTELCYGKSAEVRMNCVFKTMSLFTMFTMYLFVVFASKSYSFYYHFSWCIKMVFTWLCVSLWQCIQWPVIYCRPTTVTLIKWPPSPQPPNKIC